VTGAQILLDERVGRVFERLLRERGHDVEQAKDKFGEHTSDAEPIAWCSEHEIVLLTNNAKDFEPLHREHDHSGVFLYDEQKLPDTDPEGLARTAHKLFDQYGIDGVENQLVDRGEWYEWLHE
jgi:hypothetical protein